MTLIRLKRCYTTHECARHRSVPYTKFYLSVCLSFRGICCLFEETEAQLNDMLHGCANLNGDLTTQTNDWQRVMTISFRSALPEERNKLRSLPRLRAKCRRRGYLNSSLSSDTMDHIIVSTLLLLAAPTGRSQRNDSLSILVPSSTGFESGPRNYLH